MNIFDFTDAIVSPLELHLLESHGLAQTIVNMFKQEWVETEIDDPTELLNWILEDLDVKISDLETSDVKYIVNAINDYVA